MAKRDPLLPPPTPPDPMTVRCPVDYCYSEPYRKCCDRDGYCLAGFHQQRKKAARLAAEEKAKTQTETEQ